ncbi:TRAP-type C4-dicarboxylate transport system permease small subunit [Thermosediminibacter litoriperuensis]|uniref:TRAP-type C4-dicarboxylate transport system permease small subunit n=1 Tax=Thermosediminibacter litoriperuensis TaxID=291989 RepID=A0A5S5B126_9FIRM|nr:TRAP-type C4-dicarboxylate transport system permease small subunit [Thermosediminibacter litoriperuensis]
MVQVFLCAVVFLVFSSAICRTLKFPINWAIDLSLLLFAWTVFLGADMALRNTDLVNVDMIIKQLSPGARKGLYILWQIVILAFLASLVLYGIPLSLESSKRLFQTLGISYSWATISVPVGSFLMMISTGIKIYKAAKTPVVKGK